MEQCNKTGDNAYDPHEAEETMKELLDEVKQETEESKQEPEVKMEVEKDESLTTPMDQAATEPLEVKKEENDDKTDRKRLAGAARKRLSRMLKCGVPYDTALTLVLERRDKEEAAAAAKEQKKGEISNSSVDQDGVEKGNKKPQEGSAAKPKAQGIKVSILHQDHPGTSLDRDQLVTLQQAIMKAVEELPDDGPQVRFQNCSHGPGHLLISCTDEESILWLENLLKELKPWEEAKFKLTRGEDLPKSHVVLAFIPDDAGTRLTAEQVLTRLRKMNHGLNTKDWVVLNHEESGPGQIWTFSIDDESMKALESLNFKPYAGLCGQVHFKPRKPAVPYKKTSPKNPASRQAPSNKFGPPGTRPKQAGSRSAPSSGRSRPSDFRTGPAKSRGEYNRDTRSGPSGVQRQQMKPWKNQYTTGGRGQPSRAFSGRGKPFQGTNKRGGRPSRSWRDEDTSDFRDDFDFQRSRWLGPQSYQYHSFH